jgi:hypothetical protein
VHTDIWQDVLAYLPEAAVCFHLTFETDQSTYAIFEHVTERGPCALVSQ